MSARKKAPARRENPSWLASDPVGAGPPPPIATRPAELPFLGLGWENFERLCYRLARIDGAVEKAWSYGTTGYGQLGIDVLVRMKDGSFEAWQSKRHKKFGVADVKAAVKVFMNADWAKEAKRFVLAVACPIEDPKVIDEIEKTRTRLEQKGVTFEPLFAAELAERLKTEGEIIDDFFGRPWVERVCAPEVVAALTNRISRLDLASLRARLQSLYTAWIGIVDPGLPLAGRSGAEMPAPELSRRYVEPDIILEPVFAEREGLTADEQKPTTPEPPSQAELYRTAAGIARTGRNLRSPPSEQRLPIGGFLAEVPRAVITAEAGAGKTTLLRYLALDILSDSPTMRGVATRYAGFLPVWVPFGLWASMCEGKDRPPPLEDVAHAFIHALNEPETAESMRRVLRAGKFVLLVDGLDEASEQSVADALIVSLTVFAEQSGAPVIATSRPHGLKALSGIGGTWRRVRLAPFSDFQRSSLALLWYRILERHELERSATAAAVERQAKSRADNFIKALAASPGITRLAQNPLFLLALLKLHRLGRDLPRNRFDASKEIIEQLVEHQPKRRAKDALRLAPAQKMRQRDRLLEDFAFALHSGELRGAVADGALEADAVARGAALLARTGRTNSADADDEARAVFSFGEEVAGVLVRKAQDHIGFLHRSLQEYFAGAHLAQLSLAERIAFIGAHAAQAVWKEPILYLLFLVRNEREVGVLVEALGEAPVRDAAEEALRDALQTEAAFADFAHDITRVQQLARRLFEETELRAWGTRQQALVAATVDGLFSQSVSAQCAEKLAEWIPDYHGYGRQGAIFAMRKWDKGLQRACIPLLIRVVAGDHEGAWRAAGSVLGEFAGGDADVKNTLLRLAHQPRSAETLHGALFALGHGWPGDPDVLALAAKLRHAPLAGLQVDAIRIRAARSEADLGDLDIFLKAAVERDRLWSDIIGGDLVEYFASRHKSELLARLERAIEKSTRHRFDIPLLGALIITEPAHRLIAPALRELLAEDWSLHELFGRSKIPLERVNWTPELIELIEKHVISEKHNDYEWYWISLVLKLPSLKRRMIDSMKAGEGLTFWSSQGLAEGWGRNDAEVREAFQAMLDTPAKAFAPIAEDAASVLDDKAAVRQAILRALREKPHDTRFLMAGLRRLGIGPEDEEAFKASYEAGDPGERSLHGDGWRASMICTFAARPEIREMASAELTIRDGNIGVVADAYAADSDMCRRIMKVIAPLPNAARVSLVAELGAAAPSNPAAFGLLAATRQDTHGIAAGEAVMAWTEACIAQDTFGNDERDFLAKELRALGPEYEHRRAAAVVGLIAAGHIDVFTNLKDHKGEPEGIGLDGRSTLDESGRYLDRVLPHWDGVANALGGEESALRRLELSPNSTLKVLNPGTSGAERLFQLLEQRIASTQMPLQEWLTALRRFAPDGETMRKLIEPLLLRPISSHGPPRSNYDRWPEMMAAEIFAEYFAHSNLRQSVIDVFIAHPESECAASALAEALLRERDMALESLLRQKSKGLRYDLVTGLRVTAATGDIVGALEWLLKNEPGETFGWNCAFWTPAFLRRIERDEGAADAIIAALDRAPSASARLSELALLGIGCKDKAKTRPILANALRAYHAAPAPVIAFDVTAGAYQLAAHVVQTLLV